MLFRSDALSDGKAIKESDSGVPYFRITHGKKDIVVCAAVQTVFGRLDPYVYSNGRELEKTGVIFLEDMLSETALVKLGWILGHGEWAKNKDEIKRLMLTNIAGEFNDRLED